MISRRRSGDEIQERNTAPLLQDCRPDQQESHYSDSSLQTSRDPKRHSALLWAVVTDYRLPNMCGTWSMIPGATSTLMGSGGRIPTARKSSFGPAGVPFAAPGVVFLTPGIERRVVFFVGGIRAAAQRSVVRADVVPRRWSERCTDRSSGHFGRGTGRSHGCLGRSAAVMVGWRRWWRCEELDLPPIVGIGSLDHSADARRSLLAPFGLSSGTVGRRRRQLAALRCSN